MTRNEKNKNTPLTAGKREIAWMADAYPIPLTESQEMNWNTYIESAMPVMRSCSGTGSARCRAVCRPVI